MLLSLSSSPSFLRKFDLTPETSLAHHRSSTFPLNLTTVMATVPYHRKHELQASRADAARLLLPSMGTTYASLGDVTADVAQQLSAINFRYGTVYNTTKPRGSSSIVPSQVRRQIHCMVAKHIWEAQSAPTPTNSATAHGGSTFAIGDFTATAKAETISAAFLHTTLQANYADISKLLLCTDTGRTLLTLHLL